MNALAIAASIRSGADSAAAVVESALANIGERDREINAFTAVTADRARREAAAVDALRVAGQPLPPLAGVPFAVKNLFDVAGLTTLAGSRLNAARPPASADAVLVQRMCAAGAVLVGALNMDAYAYGFTTENTAYGATRNPHATTRTSGGSSGGSAAAVASGMVALALGSDTNGSIRVPASLCGVFGLKPTFGRLPRTGSYPFVHSLDHVGPFATCAADLAVCYDALQGIDEDDPACAQRGVERTHPALAADAQGLRVARLAGYFDAFAGPEARTASLRAAEAFGAFDEIELPEVARVRAAAFVISASEGGTLHRRTLRDDYDGFEPHNRDRFLAGALMPAAWYVQAQKLRRWFLDQVRPLFERYDVLIAPATPVSATQLGDEWFELNGRRVPLRPSLGLLTQPVSCIGLPVAAVPIAGAGPLPIGVQLIAAPWREDLCLRAAAHLERAGTARCVIAT
ncbi:MAG: AtzE family amidohydrolase [Betaproteobacteria bacterium]